MQEFAVGLLRVASQPGGPVPLTRVVTGYRCGAAPESAPRLGWPHRIPFKPSPGGVGTIDDHKIVWLMGLVNARCAVWRDFGGAAVKGEKAAPWGGWRSSAPTPTLPRYAGEGAKSHACKA